MTITSFLAQIKSSFLSYCICNLHDGSFIHLYSIISPASHSDSVCCLQSALTVSALCVLFVSVLLSLFFSEMVSAREHLSLSWTEYGELTVDGLFSGVTKGNFEV